jgi:hypothetical protein
MYGFSENPYRKYWKPIHNVLRGQNLASRFALNSKAKTFGIVPD